MLKTSEVMEIAGCSYRQLDYWQRCGLLDSRSPGSGQRRWLTSHDALLATCYRMLSTLGAESDTWELIRTFRALDDLADYGEVPWLFVDPTTGWVSTHAPMSPCYALPIGLLSEAHHRARTIEQERGSLV